jgi:leucyl aminopeptidase
MGVILCACRVAAIKSFTMFAYEHATSAAATAIHLVFDEDYDAWLHAQSTAAQRWLSQTLFRAERHRIGLIPDSNGALHSVVLGLGKRAGQGEPTLWHMAGVADRLPAGSYRIATALTATAMTQCALGWGYGQYRFERYRKSAPTIARVLLLPQTIDLADVQRVLSACAFARDLVNIPANDMTPAALAEAALQLAARFGAVATHVVGEDLLKQHLPAVHAVGRASTVPPQLVDFTWGNPAHPKVTLVGKGVCFDTGGLDLKPGASMLLMKKDMGGAASTLGLAQLVMESGLPVRLRVIIPAVENAVSGNAFRPGDVLATRAGLSVEVGNTDAEGRLVLCDGLALADAEQPELLIDMATLTGAARVALGPELPALFTTDEALAIELVRHGATVADPLWQLPLWSGYDDELGSKIADLNNVSSSGFAGAIIGGLFLKRFVHKAKAWVHIDLYAWNSKDRPGRPTGAEPQCIRALYSYLKARYCS